MRALPPIPQTDLEVSSAHSSAPSTPSLSDDSRSPSEDRSLRSSTSLRITPATVNVKFAPLPEIDPRTRSSIRPLGVAARSGMLQPRMRTRAQDIQLEPAAHDAENQPAVFIPQEVQEDDPLEVFGRYVADKGKSLFRRLSSKAKQSGKGETGGFVGDTVSAEERKAPRSRAPNGKEARSSILRSSELSEDISIDRVHPDISSPSHNDP
ncbi:hypothetical protein F5148DRAFT_905986 [Russula earlei]|uniref:Uncharacterized protein n=1 Tax=Russula earlei TaxID=71964 RepID=A0ACC0U9S1_9AGAM|nr:hypothetical protein F5148DRAFT_905986 [Russula earlei]